MGGPNGGAGTVLGDGGKLGQLVQNHIKKH